MIEELYIEDYLKIIKEEFKLNIKNNNYLNKYYSKIELLIDIIPIKQTKGNIPIDLFLLNRYSNVKEIINGERNSPSKKVKVNEIMELNNTNLHSLNKTTIYHLAINVFDKYNGSNEFYNGKDKIIVSHADIKECIKKIYNANQNVYLKEHLLVFSSLNKIIKNARMVSQGFEDKKDEQKTHLFNNLWSYYVVFIQINNNNYFLEFDVVSREDGENHYRVERIQKTDISAGNTKYSITPALETSVPEFNNTTNDY